MVTWIFLHWESPVAVSRGSVASVHLHKEVLGVMGLEVQREQQEDQHPH